MTDTVRDIMKLRNPEGPEAAAEIERLRAERDEARAYLSRLLQIRHPTVEPLPDLLGVCTQIDNALAGLLAERDRLREALQLIADASPNLVGSGPRATEYDKHRRIARAALKEAGHE